jgi:RND family efflux transporter MFP subunit
MKNGRLISTLITCILLVSLLAGCSQGTSQARQTARVTRSSIASTVTADGNLSMPREARLSFKVPGTVLTVVEKGKRVTAGTLLAKLDDKDQQIAVTNAIYDVELALNTLAEKVYPSLLGYPNFYPSVTSRLRVEQAQEELSQAIKYAGAEEFANAGSKMRILYHDLQSGLDTLQQAESYINNNPEEVKDLVGDPENYLQYYPAIHKAAESMRSAILTANEIQRKLDLGLYTDARIALDSYRDQLDETHRLVDSACGSVLRTGITYPDASTSLSVIKQAQDTMKQMRELMNSGETEKLEFAEKMELAMSDLEISQAILQSNELLLKTGVNMQQLRQYNLNYQKAEQALEMAKSDLLKTEILAPYAGTVVEVNVKTGDFLAAYEFGSIVAVRLVDTKQVEFNGNVDETDIFKVTENATASIKIDALPSESFTGNVKFISPFSSQIAGVVNYPVTIKLDPSKMELKGGLTATAYIDSKESRKDVLMLPASAIQGTKLDQYVEMVADRSKGTSEKRSVTIGVQNASMVEILSGLKEGDEVFLAK